MSFVVAVYAYSDSSNTMLRTNGKSSTRVLLLDHRILEASTLE